MHISVLLRKNMQSNLVDTALYWCTKHGFSLFTDGQYNPNADTDSIKQACKAYKVSYLNKENYNPTYYNKHVQYYDHELHILLWTKHSKLPTTLAAKGANKSMWFLVDL